MLCPKGRQKKSLSPMPKESTAVKEIAQKYYANGEIEKRVYDALMKYEVEITD